jgi:hypothetical protein
MLHHLGIQTPLETSDLLGISINHVEALRPRLLKACKYYITVLVPWFRDRNSPNFILVRPGGI